MGDWNRTTQECRVEDLSPAVNAAVQAHIERHNLGSILKDAFLCIETTSTSKKKGLFGLGKAKVVVVQAMLTPAWLVWVVTAQGSTTALSARIEDIVVSDYEQSPGYKLVPDTAIEVEGIFTGMVGSQGRRTVSMFIGLGQESPAVRFRQALKDEVQRTRRP